MPGPFDVETKDHVNQEARDTDLNWSSPHHTLGKGVTQAAPGNHTHDEYALDPHRHDAGDIDNLPTGGGTGGDKNFVFTQSTVSSVWTVDHNLGKLVAVTVTDGAGTTIFGTVKHISINQVTVTFAVGVTGKVYCN